MLLSYKPLHLEAQQRLQEEGCIVDIMPSVMKGVVLVKLPNKSDAACLHHHVYEWKDHSVRFSKVDEMVMVHVDISHEVHGLVSYAGFIP